MRLAGSVAAKVNTVGYVALRSTLVCTSLWRCRPNPQPWSAFLFEKVFQVSLVGSFRLHKIALGVSLRGVLEQQTKTDSTRGGEGRIAAH